MQTITDSFQFPPGVRFHPSDEELIVYYLLNKLNSRPLPAAVIGEVELYNYNPWDLPKKAPFGDDEWYFFSPRDRKYPNGARPNRTAASGYWKATGTDKPILSSSGARIGVKKALVFYIGKPPNGVKTDWIMIEYRIPDTLIRPQRSKTSMRLDDWVLCRIRQKGNMSKNKWDVPYSPSKQLVGGDNQRNMKEEQQQLQSSVLNYTDNTSDMICPNYFLAQDCHLLAKLLANQDFPPTISTVTTTTSHGQSPSQSKSQSSNSTTKNYDEPCVHGFKITKESCDDHDQVINSYNSNITSSLMNLQGKQPSDGNGYGYGYRYVSNSQPIKTTPHYLINNKNDINLLSNNNMLAANVSSCFFNQDVSQGGDEFKHNLSNAIMNLHELDMSAFAEKFLQ